MTLKNDDDSPWLRDLVDDDLRILFSNDENVLKKAARAFIEDAEGDPDLEGRLIDLLAAALELGNDDSSASVLTAVVLGEVRSTRAIQILKRCLASDADETLQDAARISLLRLGEPAVEAVMDEVEEEDDPAFNRAGYGLLGMVGALEDDAISSRVKDFLESRVEAERRRPPAESAAEELFRACAQLGDRRQIPVMKKVLAEDFRGRHPGIQDAVELLEENTAGMPIVPDPPLWEERYGWLFDDERGDEARERTEWRQRQAEGGAAGNREDDRKDSDRSRQSRLLWGLNTAYSDAGEEEGLDARRFLTQPKADEEQDSDAAGDTDEDDRPC